jgi:transcriptional regulator with XRE-family HTH domain
MPRRPHDRALLVSFGARLRELRESGGLTQQRLAEAAGVEPKTISVFESGGFAPTITTASVLARVLGVRLSDLFEGVGAPIHAEPGDPEEAAVLDDYRELSAEKRRVVRELLRVIR